jgi:hypothetical protein
MLALGAPLVLTACATIGPPQPPSLELPKPPTDLRAVRKGDHVILAWTIPTITTDRQSVSSLGPTRICRETNAEFAQCGTPVGQAPPSLPKTSSNNKSKQPASYTDTLPAAIESDSTSTSIAYAIEVLNRDGRGAGLSNRIQVPLIHTPPAPPDFQAKVTSQGIVLTWAAATPTLVADVHFTYRVYRRREDQNQSTMVGEIPFSDQQTFSLTDSEIEWEKTYEYRAEVVTLISAGDKPPVQVEGDDTPIAKVFADDIFPPAVPSGLQAVFSGPGQQPFIDLVWAPVTDMDLAGYNVYRHTEGLAPKKLNAELIKTPAYRDANVEHGQKLTYSITAVDQRGNESGRSEEASESVP